MANKVNTQEAPMTAEEIRNKYNGGRNIIDFVGKKKIFFIISGAILIIGIICNLFFGTTLDIQFSGGATLTYSYTGEIDHEELDSFIQGRTAARITTAYSTDLLGNTGNNVSVQFSGDYSANEEATGDEAQKANVVEIQKNLTADLQKQYPDNNFKMLEANSVDPSMGISFLLKCLTAVAIASLLMVAYVFIRFRVIGGLSAGVMALVALFHDIAMIYFLYVILRMPIDSSFIAVILMILGYSLNDTIVIYDRVREQKKLMPENSDIATIFNISCTKTIKRTIMTSVTTFAAILTVYIVATVFNISSVKSFALPMMIGVISGCYSSICIAGPLWVVWQNHKAKKKAE